MKTKGRKSSNNIDDARAYFGSNSISPGNRDINQRQNAAAFKSESFKAARDFKGTKDWNSFSSPSRTNSVKNKK